MADVLWYNGAVRDTNDVPVTPEAGLWRGEGLFETLAVRRNEIYNVEAHLRRLKQTIDEPDEDLFGQLKSGLPEMVDRFERNRGRLKLVYWTDDQSHHLAGWIRSYDPPDLEDYRNGVSLEVETSSHPPRWPLSHEKRTSYAGVMERRRQASGWDVLYCDLDGMVRECGIANILWFDGEGLLTPPQGDDVLAGTVLEAVKQISNDGGLSFEEKTFNYERPESDVYVLNSLVGILPVNRIGDSSVDHHGENPVWETLRPQLGSDKVIPLWYDD